MRWDKALSRYYNNKAREYYAQAALCGMTGITITSRDRLSLLSTSTQRPTITLVELQLPIMALQKIIERKVIIQRNDRQEVKIFDKNLLASWLGCTKCAMRFLDTKISRRFKK